MKNLAVHIADLPGWIHRALTTVEFHFQNPYTYPEINTEKALFHFFEKSYAEGISSLTPEKESLLNKP